jgi:hypothetical protein
MMVGSVNARTDGEVLIATVRRCFPYAQCCSHNMRRSVPDGHSMHELSNRATLVSRYRRLSPQHDVLQKRRYSDAEPSDVQRDQ